MADNEVIVLDDSKGSQKEASSVVESEQEEFVSLDELSGVKPAQISDDDGTDEEEEQKSKKLSKKMIIIAGAGGGVLLLLIILVLVLALGGKKDQVIVEPAPAPIITPEPPTSYKINKGRIEEMIGKANSLYDAGNKIEALKIYENVAIYNEALSYYNLGVSQMNQEKFADALGSFKKAISNQEHTDVSALNAAVCALHLGDEKLFKYYIDLSRAFLTPNSSAYSYYSALVNYYAGYYIESFHILKSIEDGFYANNAKYLKSKILSLIRRDEDAIAALEGVKDYDVNFPLGLLNARLEKYDEAIYYLNRVDPLSSNIDVARLAKALIQLKTGSYANASKTLEELNDANATFISKIYPIKAGLKDDYFNINAAQKNFDDKVFFHKNSTFAMLFYFTPYKTFDAKQTLDYIAKGGIGVFVSQSDDADEYLRTSGVISRVNAGLSKAIEMALNNELWEANKEFAKLIQDYPGHSILQYNLALSYAQRGDFANGYKHFISSYHLNPKNHLAGIYAILCAQLVGRDYRHLHAEVSEGLNGDESLKTGNFYETLLLYLRGNNGALGRWLDETNSKETLHIAFSTIAAMTINRKDEAQKYSTMLLEKLPNDVMSNILHFLAHNERTDIKTYAKQIQMRFFNSKLDLNTLYGGSSAVKEQFVKLLQISGLTDVWREVVLKDLQKAKNKDSILHALAYVDLFTRRHDEAFNIYNDLVHNKKEQDSYTLFLAAVASIGSNHPQNAVAYLELARITNPTDPSSRIALGLLYQELGNLSAAVAQYKSIGNTDYKSRFFTFYLDN